MKKKDGRNRSASAQAAIREQVVEFLKKKGNTQQRASEIFGLSRSGVEKICRIYRKSGIPGLREKKRGVREGKKINNKQFEEVRLLIKDKLPDQLKLPFGLWTRQAVQQLIKKRYGIVLSRWQVGRFLKSWGYTLQKPIHKAFEQKSEKVKEWLEKDYPAIKKRAAKEKAVIYFGDETDMRNNPQAATSYTPAGETPVIKKTGQRFSLNMISAISNRGHLQFMIIDGRLNGEVFQIFLQQMIKHSREKIFFVIGGHPSYKTKKLKEWLDKKRQRLEVHFLRLTAPTKPSGIGENQDVKTNVTGKKRPIN